MGQRRLPSLWILVPVVVLLAGAGAWHLAVRKSLPRVVNRESSAASSNIRPTISASSAVTTPDSQPAVPATANLTGSTPATAASQAPGASLPAGSSANDIQFIAPEKIATANFSDKDGDSDTDTTYVFYRVGRFARGPNQGAELLMASVSRIDWPCKGHCGEPVLVRYIEKDKVVFPLPKISDPQAPANTVGRGTSVDERPFANFGATAGQASDFSMPVLEYPQTIAAGPHATLQRTEEGIGVLNPAVLQLTFHDPVYGDVWMTKPGLSPQRVFYEECKDVNPKAKTSEGGCENLPAFTDNALYFFRPDGTYLSYVYQPDFRPDDTGQATWKDGPLPVGTAYVDHTLVGCSWDSADAISVVSPASVSEGDLEAIGKVTGRGDPLYGLKDKKHRLYREFYDAYDSSFPTWASQIQNDQTAKQLSYDDFVKARPLFLWKDPFGRLIRFVNTSFIVPNACEPIVYLYPPQTENIQVKLGEDVTVFDSYPAYQEGWNVNARPDGELTDLRSGRRTRYLFWEGRSYVLPPQRRGFVVRSSDVAGFLGGVLPRLGLDQKEAGDFIAAWSSKLTAAPYYFISFVERSVIDQYYPLRIEPAPDTVIRVFMDFTPLSKPIAVEPPLLASPPQRKGLTVVEWGVLVR
jgi:hypothetical protein